MCRDWNGRHLFNQMWYLCFWRECSGLFQLSIISITLEVCLFHRFDWDEMKKKTEERKTRTKNGRQNDTKKRMVEQASPMLPDLDKSRLKLKWNMRHSIFACLFLHYKESDQHCSASHIHTHTHTGTHTQSWWTKWNITLSTVTRSTPSTEHTVVSPSAHHHIHSASVQR